MYTLFTYIYRRLMLATFYYYSSDYYYHNAYIRTSIVLLVQCFSFAIITA